MEMEEMKDLDEFVAPNGRHNLFKCSMCDIFCFVCNMLPPQYLFRISFIFSATALPGEGPLSPVGPPPPAGPPSPAGPPPPTDPPPPTSQVGEARQL